MAIFSSKTKTRLRRRPQFKGEKGLGKMKVELEERVFKQYWF